MSAESRVKLSVDQTRHLYQNFRDALHEIYTGLDRAEDADDETWAETESLGKKVFMRARYVLDVYDLPDSMRRDVFENNCLDQDGVTPVDTSLRDKVEKEMTTCVDILEENCWFRESLPKMARDHFAEYVKVQREQLDTLARDAQQDLPENDTRSWELPEMDVKELGDRLDRVETALGRAKKTLAICAKVL